MDNILEMGLHFEAGALKRDAQQGAKALDGLGKSAKVTGADLGRMAREGDGAEETLHELTSTADRTERAVERLGSRIAHGVAGFSKYGTAIRSAGRAVQYGAEKMVNQYTAVAGGAGFGYAMKQAMDFDSKLRRIAINARDAQGKIQDKNYVTWIQEVRKEMLELSNATGVAPDGLIAGLERIQQLSGDVALARRQMGLAAQVSVISGADVAEVANLMDVLNKQGGVSQDAMRETMTMIVAMGRGGSFDVSQFASEGARMMTVLPQFGQGGKTDAKSLESFTAMANVAMSASGGDKGMARTAVIALASDLSNTAILRSRAKQAGISTSGLADALYTDKTRSTMRSVEDMVRRIIVLTKGRTESINTLFGEGSQGMVNTIANNWRSNGNSFAYLDQMHESARTSAQGTNLGKDFRDTLGASDELNRSFAQLRQVTWDLAQFVLDKLNPALAWANNHGETFRTIIIGIGSAFAAAAALVAAGKVKQFVSGALGAMGMGGGGIAAGLPGVYGGATPVWIVGSSVGGMGGAASAVAGEAAAMEQAAAQGAAKSGLMSRLFPTFGRWIQSSGAWLGNSARSLGVWGQGRMYAAQRMLGGSAAGRWALNAGEGLMERSAGLWRNTMWGGMGGSMLRFANRLSPLARGVAGSALLGLPLEYMLNGVSWRSTAAGMGSAIGGTLGFMGGGALGAAGTFGVGAAPMGIVGAGLGGTVGREGALAAFDWISGLLSGSDQADKFAPQFTINVSMDAQGRPTTRVDGPGATAMGVNVPRLMPQWAPAPLAGYP